MKGQVDVSVPMILTSWRHPCVAAFAAVLFVLQPKGVVAQATSAVREANVRYSAALSSGDADTATSFFEAAGALAIEGCPEIKGRSDVGSFLASITRAGRVVSLTPEDVTQTGPDLAREVGTFRIVGTVSRKASHDGRYATSWVKVGGEWRISESAWTSGSVSGGTGTIGGRDGDRCALIDVP